MPPDTVIIILSVESVESASVVIERRDVAREVIVKMNNVQAQRLMALLQAQLAAGENIAFTLKGKMTL